MACNNRYYINHYIIIIITIIEITLLIHMACIILLVSLLTIFWTK